MSFREQLRCFSIVDIYLILIVETRNLTYWITKRRSLYHRLSHQSLQETSTVTVSPRTSSLYCQVNHHTRSLFIINQSSYLIFFYWIVIDTKSSYLDTIEMPAHQLQTTSTI